MSPQASSAPSTVTKPSAAPPWYDWQACLGRASLFRELSRGQLRRVSSLAEARHYRDGRAIVTAGAAADTGAFFAIVDGRARVETPSGHVRMLETYDSFGELALLDGAPRAATVTAVGDVTVARIDGPAFRRLLEDEPSFATAILRSLVAVVRDIQAERGVTVVGTGTLPGHGTWPQDEYGEDRSLTCDEAERALAAVPLFRALSRRHLRTIARQVQLHVHPAGSVVVHAGAERAWFFHIIVGGTARVTAAGCASVLHPGDYFGELALLDGAPRAAEVVAEGPLTTLQLSGTPFARLLRDEPAVTLGLITGLVAIVRDLQRAR